MRESGRAKGEKKPSLPRSLIFHFSPLARRRRSSSLDRHAYRFSSRINRSADLLSIARISFADKRRNFGEDREGNEMKVMKILSAMTNGLFLFSFLTIRPTLIRGTRGVEGCDGKGRTISATFAPFGNTKTSGRSSYEARRTLLHN